MLLRIIFVAFALLLFFRLISFLNKRISYSRVLKHHLGYIIPVVELLSWIGFIFWCIQFIYETKNYIGLIISGVILLLLVIPSFFFLNDFLSGVYLKIQRKIDEGNNIQVDNIKGKITNTGQFSLDIKTTQGNVETIPYSKIRNRIISKSSDNPYLNKQLLVLRFEKSTHLKTLISALKTTLFNAPWISASEEPVIGEIKEENNLILVNVFVYTLKREYIDNIREYVYKNLLVGE